MRGYLHGGIIVDLIGQKGPTSKIHLLLLDLLILVLQCFMLTVHVERERLSAFLTKLLKLNTASDQPRVEVVSAQNIDAEERGVTGDDGAETSNLVTEPTDAENGDMRPHDTEDVDLERARLLDETSPPEELADDNPLELLWSGTAVVSDFHVLDTLRKQWADYGNASASALQTVGFSAEFAANTANRRLNAASERFQRGVESLAG